MYIDLIQLGPMFKHAVFQLIQRIHSKGEIPDEFKQMTLMKLHKKGPRNVIDNYWWLHLKDWMSKLTEKVILKKMRTHFVQGTRTGSYPWGAVLSIWWPSTQS